jgi:hypothetical protein
MTLERAREGLRACLIFELRVLCSAHALSSFHSAGVHPHGVFCSLGLVACSSLSFLTPPFLCRFSRRVSLRNLGLTSISPSFSLWFSFSLPFSAVPDSSSSSLYFPPLLHDDTNKPPVLGDQLRQSTLAAVYRERYPLDVGSLLCLSFQC